MSSLLTKIRRGIVEKMSDTKFSYTERVFDIESGGAVSQWVLLLPGSGCTWAKEKGGCYMCGFKFKIKETNKGRPASHRYLMMVYRLGQVMVSDVRAERLTIYNGGSFLNSAEIPKRTQERICRQVEKHPTIKKLFIESRPEFVTHKKITTLKSLLGDKKLEVGIGLECATDEIRERCIHKGFSRKDYKRAVAILKEKEAEVLTYVFLKPLYLTEQEAIEEAIRTIEYAFQAGSDEVAIESAFIQKETKMETLYSRGEYKVPWLWSIIQVVEDTHHLGPVSIGGFEDEPQPIEIPHNCSKCSHHIMKLFAEYKETHDIRLFDDLECECKSAYYKSALEADEKSLE
ncbi:MAG: archaeosine biosynthesis radical SAM protein RaSEA [Pseudomonadota bacterium]